MDVVQRGALLTMARTDDTEDRAARFEALFAAYSDVIYSYARRRMSKQEAEDVVSDAFLIAWRRLDDIPTEPVSWLIVVARNVIANRRRADDRRATMEARLRRSPDVTNVPDPGVASASEPRVLDALAGLPVGEREVIELIAWEGLSPAEVATALGIVRATVYVRLHRARQRLTRTLAEEEHE